MKPLFAAAVKTLHPKLYMSCIGSISRVFKSSCFCSSYLQLIRTAIPMMINATNIISVISLLISYGIVLPYIKHLIGKVIDIIKPVQFRFPIIKIRLSAWIMMYLCVVHACSWCYMHQSTQSVKLATRCG